MTLTLDSKSGKLFLLEVNLHGTASGAYYKEVFFK